MDKLQMENEQKKSEYCPVFKSKFRPFQGFPLSNLSKVPLISQQYYSLVLSCLRDIEHIKGINFAFSPIFLYAFGIVEIAILVSVYFFPLIVIAFWVILLLFFVFLHKRRKSFSRVMSKSKQLIAKYTGQMESMYKMELEMNSNSFLGWNQFAYFVLSVNKTVVDAISSTPAELNIISPSSIAMAQKQERYQVEKVKLVLYNSQSDLSSSKKLKRRSSSSSSSRSFHTSNKKLASVDLKLDAKLDTLKDPKKKKRKSNLPSVAKTDPDEKPDFHLPDPSSSTISNPSGPPLQN